MGKIELAGETRRAVAILDAQLAPGAVAIGVHRCLGHPELAGDLFGRQVLIDQPQAFTLTRRKKRGWIVRDIRSCAHNADT